MQSNRMNRVVAIAIASSLLWSCAASDTPGNGHLDSTSDFLGDDTDNGSGVETCNGYDDDGDTLIDENTNLLTDVLNCGECDNACHFLNASAECNSGVCQLGPCMPNYFDVNGNEGDGCEYMCLVGDDDGDTDIDTEENQWTCHDGEDNDCDGLVDVIDPDCSECLDEVCNEFDDDCDELVDEGFDVLVDPLNCGECGNVCPSPGIHTVPVCLDGVCEWECVPGWVDGDHIEETGCETYGCTPGSSDEPDSAYVDVDCDGIDGTITRAIFVATSGDDSWPGSQSQPKRSIQAGITAAAADSLKDHVYVSRGTYYETLTLTSGTSVFGGFDAADAWDRADDHTVVVDSPDTVAVVASSITVATTLGFMTIESADAVLAGGYSVGIQATGSSALALVDLVVVAGRGAPGGNGSPGSLGESYTTYPAMAGGNGLGGCEYDCHCGAACWAYDCGSCSRPGGGSAGSGPCGTSGGNGGQSGTYASTGSVGGSGSAGAPGGSGGAPTCSGAYATGGTDGGSPAYDMALNGSGANDTGAFIVGVWHPSDGAAGQRGLNGAGGGGGGGGGGDCSESCLDGWCSSYGGTGGGGGAGGCGGYSGAGGTGGGGSFAMVLENSSATVKGCSLSTGGGGRGGNGGNGGAGGIGGPGGTGGAPETTDQGGYGGAGGRGGSGTQGGNGGGGGGGPSVGLALVGTSAPIVSGVLYSLGSGGSGGTSSGNPGSSGLVANTHNF